MENCWRNIFWDNFWEVAFEIATSSDLFHGTHTLFLWVTNCGYRNKNCVNIPVPWLTVWNKKWSLDESWCMGTSIPSKPGWSNPKDWWPVPRILAYLNFVRQQTWEQSSSHTDHEPKLPTINKNSPFNSPKTHANGLICNCYHLYKQLQNAQVGHLVCKRSDSPTGQNRGPGLGPRPQSRCLTSHSFQWLLDGNTFNDVHIVQ